MTVTEAARGARVPAPDLARGGMLLLIAVANTQMREVDVLITAHVAGHRVEIGIECWGRSRKDAVSWVEEIRAKHDDLPTDRLVLVSAVAKARHYGIEAVTPGQPIAEDGPWPGSGIRGWSFVMSPTSGWWPSAAP
ncbi:MULTISPECIES: hypothetical protein [unclassified Nonomuraea]|uniref:hypothetical protein n=1 Tax=unclassified Nonomuraea TaxID=2593643 RepID=UPI0033C91817